MPASGLAQRIRWNLLAGFSSSLWAALIGLLVIPLYLKYLGIEAYGLIGFFATLQALFWLFDLGLSPTINREVSRCSVSGNWQEAGSLLHTFAVIYWTMGTAIALFLVTLAPIIAEYWLQSRRLPIGTITHSIMIMGLIVACRWPIALYQGALIGAQRLTISSGISSVMVTLGNIGAVGVLAFISPTIEAFFIWQAGVGLVHVATMRWATWRLIGYQSGLRFQFDALKRIWRFSAGMSGVAVSTMILMQFDKVLLSKILSLDDFGRYALAGVVTSGLYVLLTPVFNVIYPRFTALIVAGNTEELTNLYRLGTRLLSAILFPIATVSGVFAGDFVHLWTGNLDLSIKVAPIISLLLMGTAINGVMIFPYALQLANEEVRLPLKICIILIIGIIPTTIFLALNYGAIGAAAAWTLMNSVYLLMGSWLTHRMFLKGIGLKWLFWDVGVPLVFSLLVIRFVGERIHNFGQSPIVNLAMAFGLVLISILLTISASPRLVTMLRNVFKNKKLA